MAGGGIIGALRVVLGADSAALDKGYDDARAKIAGFAASVGSSMAIAATAAVAAGGAMALAFEGAVDKMDELSKTSARVGVPIEQLSALKYAADLSDVSLEELGKSVGKLSKTMVEAAAKPTSEAAYAFRALGVSVVDGNGKLRSSSDVLGAVADKFEGLKDGAGKTAAAMAVFGKSGASIIPLLNGGRDGLKEMTEEAQKFGLVVSAEAGRSAENFNDNLTRLQRAWEGVILQASTKILPVMVQISDALVDSAKNSGVLELAVKGATIAMQAMATAGVIVGATLKAAASNIAAVAGALMAVKEGDFSGAFGKLKAGVSDLTTTATSAYETINKLWGGAKDGADKASAATDQAAKTQKDFNFAAMAGKTAVDQFIDGQNKSLASMQAEIATFGMLAGAREAARIQLQAQSIATANHMAITAAQQAQLDVLKQKTADYAMTLAGLQMTQSNLTPAQAYELELAKIQGLFDAGKISAETYDQAMQNAAEHAGASWGQASASMAGSFATISAAFGKENSAMAKAAQIFGAIQATISMFTGAAKALELPFPANLAAMAAVLAKGASLVASIKSQSVPTGFKTGGSFTVGGSGAPDSKLVPIMATPGEQVDIWRPGERGMDDPRRGAGGAPTVVNLSMGVAATREGLRQMLDGINDMLADGYVLKVRPA